MKYWEETIEDHIPGGSKNDLSVYKQYSHCRFIEKKVTFPYEERDKLFELTLIIKY